MYREMSELCSCFIAVYSGMILLLFLNAIVLVLYYSSILVNRMVVIWFS